MTLNQVSLPAPQKLTVSCVRRGGSRYQASDGQTVSDGETVKRVYGLCFKGLSATEALSVTNALSTASFMDFSWDEQDIDATVFLSGLSLSCAPGSTEISVTLEEI